MAEWWDVLMAPELQQWWAPALLVALSLPVALAIRRRVFVWLERWAQRTAWTFDDVIIKAIRDPFVLWVVLAAAGVALAMMPLAATVIATGHKILGALFVFSLTLAAAKIAAGLVTRYAAKSGAALPSTTLTHNLVQVVVIGLGGLIILNTLGIAITPLLTAMGIGGLAVALGLQPTLANLFAGVQMSVTRDIRVGDYIKLNSGEEGYVVDINWRETHVRTLPNNLIILPNIKIAESIVTNYYRPDQELAVLVEVGVQYGSDLARVEQVTSEVGEQVMQEVPGGVPTFKPFIRCHTFGESSINFTVILRAKEFVDQYLIKHEFIKRLHRRYQQECIIIPFPIRTVYLHQAVSNPAVSDQDD